MRLLLDTHAALWWLAGDERFGPEAAAVVAEPGNDVLLSAAVVWEIAVKRSLGKLRAPSGFAETLLGAGVRELPVSAAHAAAVEQLPWHHRDPFDRMLAAQATVEGATIVTRDETLARYGVSVVW